MERNYIILNGVPSWEIPGLIINSLPPVTKAPRRTDLQKADGMNGDVRTNLGYDSYDREIEIGILEELADYEMILRYFNSDGYAVFSNEPDMFYNYYIDNQIDFEKLVRFKKASVVFRVFPEKRSLLDFVVEKDFTFTRTDSSFVGELEVTNAGNIDAKTRILIFPGYNTPSTSGNLSLKIEIFPNGETAASGRATMTTIFRENSHWYFIFDALTGNVSVNTGISMNYHNNIIKGDVTSLVFKPGVNILKVTALTDGSFVKSIATSEYSRWI